MDVLVDEVQEAPPAWQPHEAAGAWQTAMGAPEEDAWGARNAPVVDVLEDLGAPAADPYDAPAAAQPTAPAEAWTPAEPGGYELDRGFEPAGSSVAPVEAAPEPPAAPARPLAAEVLLTDVASGASLFADPDLEVARLAEGTAREIQVPVVMGEGGRARRFVLSVKLTLTSVD